MSGQCIYGRQHHLFCTSNFSSIIIYYFVSYSSKSELSDWKEIFSSLQHQPIFYPWHRLDPLKFIKSSTRNKLLNCDCLITPLPVFPLLNVLYNSYLSSSKDVIIYDQGKPNTSLEDFLLDLDIRNDIRVSSLANKFPFLFKLSRYKIIGAILKYIVSLRLSLLFKVDNYLTHVKFYRLRYSRPIINPYTGVMSKKLLYNCINYQSKITVLCWHEIDTSFYKEIGFVNTYKSEHPGQLFITQTVSNILTIYPSDNLISSDAKSNLSIALYVKAVGNIIKSEVIDEIYIRFRVCMRETSFSKLFYNAVVSSFPSLPISVEPNHLTLLESIERSSCVLGDITSCLWLSSSLAKPTYVITEIDPQISSKMLAYPNTFSAL